MKGSVWLGFFLGTMFTTITIMAFPIINFPQFPEFLWLLINFRYLIAILSMSIAVWISVKWMFKLFYRFHERRLLVQKEWKWLIWMIPFACTLLLLWWKFPLHVFAISIGALTKEWLHWNKKKREFVHL